MARLEIDVGSVPGVTLDVIAPEPECGQTFEENAPFYRKKYPAIWLLHGLGGISSDWLRYSMVELFAKEKNIFVIAPTGENGFFINCSNGDAWEKRIGVDLWEYVHNLFPMMSNKPADNVVAGVDMGGYGAIHFALKFPDKFSYAASFSGMLDYPSRYAQGLDLTGDMVHVFGQPDESGNGNSDADLWKLALKMRENRDKTGFYIACGKTGAYYSANKEYSEHLKNLGFETEWIEEDCEEDWRFWNRQLERFLDTRCPAN